MYGSNPMRVSTLSGRVKPAALVASHQTTLVATATFECHKLECEVVPVERLLTPAAHGTRQHPEAPATVARTRAAEGHLQQEDKVSI